MSNAKLSLGVPRSEVVGLKERERGGGVLWGGGEGGALYLTLYTDTTQKYPALRWAATTAV